jgi:hypothetical protein
MTCIWFELFSRIAPFPGWRLRLCERHVSRCPRCRQASDGKEALPPILVTAEQLPHGLDLRPGVREGIARLRKPAAGPGPAVIPLSPRGFRSWAYAGAMALLLLAAGFWTVLQERHSKPQPVSVAVQPSVQTRLCSAKIEDKPARVFQFQSRNPDRSIFWIAKDDKRS